MVDNSLSEKLKTFIEGKPFELIIYEKNNNLTDALTTDISHEGVDMSNCSQRYLNSQLRSKQYSRGQLFTNKNNLFPHVIILSDKNCNFKEINYFISSCNCKILLSKPNKPPKLVEHYHKQNGKFTINFFD